ncbi:unnamed protein product [Phytophthora lilii]|uniref:Unnamed protein product n=1 Tax=Phytophthora lilii TaxID=2077276 RepID=A0A9W6UBZ5_9STRA|nr:unnamed protein product [Phytophthora lilii]
MAQTYQAHEKARRAQEHNESLSRRERAAIPRTARGEPSAGTSNDQSGGTDATNEAPMSLFEPGHRVWLYMERVKPGLTKKLAHRWHGPFRIKKKVEEYAYELKLPDRSGYRFYPVVHVSRFQPVNEDGDRPKTRLAPS